MRAGKTVPAPPVAMRQELKSSATPGSVLDVAAHPDDENTQLITMVTPSRDHNAQWSHPKELVALLEKAP